MSAIVVHQPRRAGAQWGRGLIAAALIGACLGGTVLAVDMLRGNNPLASSTDEVNGPHLHTIGEDVSTRFGVVAVEHATAISGLNDQQVTGAHGVPGLVKEGAISIQVAAVITNLSDSRVGLRADTVRTHRQNGRRCSGLQGSTPPRGVAAERGDRCAA